MWKPILITTNTSPSSIQPQYFCSQEIIISLVCVFWDLTITLYPWLSTVHLQWYLFLLETPTLGWWGLNSSLLTCQHCHQWGVHIRRNQTCTSGGFRHSRGEMYIVITIIQDEKNVRGNRWSAVGFMGWYLPLTGQELILSLYPEKQDLGWGEAKSRYTRRRKAERYQEFTRLFHFPRL